MMVTMVLLLLMMWTMLIVSCLDTLEEDQDQEEKELITSVSFVRSIVKAGTSAPTILR